MRYFGELDPLDDTPESDLTLALRLDLSPIPYSAENPTRQGFMLDFARSVVDMPLGFQRSAVMTRLEYSAKTRLHGPVLGIDIMSTAVAVLMGSTSFLDQAKFVQRGQQFSGTGIFAAEQSSKSLH